MFGGGCLSLLGWPRYLGGRCRRQTRSIGVVPRPEVEFAGPILGSPPTLMLQFTWGRRPTRQKSKGITKDKGKPISTSNRASKLSNREQLEWGTPNNWRRLIGHS